MTRIHTKYLCLLAAFALFPLAAGCGESNSQGQGDVISVPDGVTVPEKEEGDLAYAGGEVPDPNEPMSGVIEAALAYTPEAQTYELPVELGAVGYLPEIEDKMKIILTEDQAAGLSANGVIALHAGEFERFEDAYAHVAGAFFDESIWGYEIQPPLMVTSDSVLHLYHLFFDQLLKFSEVKEFIAMLDLMVPGMAQASSLQQQVLTGDLAEAARRNKAYFLVAARLLDPGANVPADVKDLVEAELALIEATPGLKPSPIFNQDCPEACDPCQGADQLACKDFICMCEDYSQYKPRGHYTQSEDLKRYFRAMIWLGRIGLRIKSDMETVQAVLATDSLKSVTVEYKGETLAASLLWQRIYKVTSFFVGAADDLTFHEYDRAVRTALGESFQLSDLADAANLAKLKVELDKLREPEILGGFVAALLDETAETKGWRFMGQRFAPDSYVLGRMVWDHVDPDLTSPEFSQAVGACMEVPDECVEIAPEVSDCICYAGLIADPKNAYGVCRLLPRGLDVMAVLGSETAVSILEQDQRYCTFSDQLGALSNEFAEYTVADWTQNAYWAWLHALKPVLAVKGEGWPVWMQSFAWQVKQLNCALTSWAELRHDTILYVKQSYTPAVSGTSAPLELEFAGYVEPLPDFYHRLAFLSRFTREGLADLDLLPQGAADAMVASETLLEELREIAIKELEGSELSDADQQTIVKIGDIMTGIIEKLAGAVTVESSMEECETDPEWCMEETELAGDAFKTSLVADVHTDGNTEQVLEVAGGKLDWILVVHKAPGGQLVASIGPIFTYYEFPHPMDNRLTDEEWRTMLDNNPPSRPEWTGEMY